MTESFQLLYLLFPLNISPGRRQSMAKKISVLFYFSLFLLIPYYSFSQNLITNGDFESYSSCPTTISQLDLAVPWFNPCLGGNYGTPDYYNQCSTNPLVSVPGPAGAYQPSHSGAGYAGLYLHSPYFVPSFREYIECPISDQLAAGECYHLEMYVNLQNTSQFTTDDIHVYFSDTIIENISNWDVLPFVPQILNPTFAYPDTVNWMLVSGDYTAHGGESYMVIGNFYNDSNMTLIQYQSFSPAYVYILVDDVVLYNCLWNEIQKTDKQQQVYFSNKQLHYKVSGAYLSVYSLSGQCVFNRFIDGENILDLSGFNDGLYFYSLTSDDGSSTKGKFEIIGE